MSELALDLLQNYYQIAFAPCEVLIPVLIKFALSFFFWIYFMDNSIVTIVNDANGLRFEEIPERLKLMMSMNIRLISWSNPCNIHKHFD
jgi:hypothetical protein